MSRVGHRRPRGAVGGVSGTAAPPPPPPRGRAGASGGVAPARPSTAVATAVKGRRWRRARDGPSAPDGGARAGAADPREAMPAAADGGGEGAGEADGEGRAALAMQWCPRTGCGASAWRVPADTPPPYGAGVARAEAVSRHQLIAILIRYRP